MPRPSEKPTWATDHTIEPEGTASGASGFDVIDPGATKQGDGWDYKESPPYQFMNWLFRLIGDWLVWFDDFDQNHIHDGAAGDYSAPKVNLGAHIDYGANGSIAVGTDTATEHRVAHTHGGAGVSQFEADQIHTDFVEPKGAGPVRFQDASDALQPIEAWNAPVAQGRINTATGATADTTRGVASVATGGTGLIEITTNESWSGLNACVVANVWGITAGDQGFVGVEVTGTNTVQIQLWDLGGVAQDGFVYFAIYRNAE